MFTINNLCNANVIIFVLIAFIVLLIIYNYCKVSGLSCGCNETMNVCGGGQQNNNIALNNDLVSLNSNNATLQTNNDTTNNSGKAIITLFHTTWCGYSRQFMPEWEKVKNAINSNTTIAQEYDCDKNKDICMKNKIAGYPGLTLTKTNGTVVNFPNTMPRNYDTVMNFIKQNS